ncbi:uncharacterized protein STEHIDRAFT_151951 [Stereum hirsutum FP-91666 SS1]|uniref:uncharacterized protein n=1 Tax=Stereum hirsutum (strain FP-91666) TaxID=721885 RepID=UPI000440EF68|nr:uncharacterized protein STEHIDRAFT_151951 [Stereum hirsutum FP-91666 SS1]EIM92634.1 hypothetical protein STEHIDRAFT_151951 [Stereum hirsutum FP-91666 SS1]
MSRSPHGAELMGWLNEALACEAEEADPLLQKYTLEEEEINILRRAERHESWFQAAQQSSGHDHITYLPPSKLHEKQKLLEAEKALYEEETEVLKIQLSQAKLASREASKAIRSFQSMISKTDKDVTELKGSLSELSLKADASVSSTLRSTTQALLRLEEIDDDELCSRLEALSDVRSDIISANNFAQPILPVTPSNHEITRLQRSLERLPHPEVSVDALRYEEFEKIMQNMHDLSNGDVAHATAFLHDIISEGAEESIELDRPRPKEEIERAWWIDYHTFTLPDNVLTQSIQRFTDLHDPHLTSLHEYLGSTLEIVQKTEAYARVFQQETQHILNDADVSSKSETVDNAAPGNEQLIVDELVEVLKQHQHLRPETAQPLVLLSDADLCEEIRALLERSHSSERVQFALPAQISQASSALLSQHQPLLDILYANSPLPTSPPSAAPPELQELETRTRSKIDTLDHDLGDLAKEIELSSRTKKKLAAFVR